jgi:hypothetical protein
MSAVIDDRNPLGVTFTKEQQDEFARDGYWYHAIEYGLDYYIAGRFATAHRAMPLSASILHLAVEMMLKACLAKDDPIDTILQYGSFKKGYRHNLARLWQEFRSRHQLPLSTEFDATIASLHDFEELRYPDILVQKGAMVTIEVFDNPPVANGPTREKQYRLKLPEIDRLMGLLFAASAANPDAFLPRITEDKTALMYYDMVRLTLFGRTAPAEPPSAAPAAEAPSAKAWRWWPLIALLVAAIGAAAVWFRRGAS